MTNTTPPQPQITISASTEVEKGQYTNAVQVLITDNEMFVDFALVYPNNESTKKGVLTNRIIMSHQLAVDLSNNILQTLKSHNDKQKNVKK